MVNKINPITGKHHPTFRELLVRLQTDRINAGKETIQKKVALWKLEKTIFNLIEANPALYKKLVEVDINVQS